MNRSDPSLKPRPRPLAPGRTGLFPHGPRLLFVTGCALLSACARMPSGLVTDATSVFTSDAAATPPVALELPPARRVPYRVGDTFVYGRIGVERVSAVGRDGLEWTGPEGQTFRTGLDFFTPLTQPDGQNPAVTSTLEGSPGALWPLSVGREVVFEEVRRAPALVSGRPSETRYRWECRVEDTRISAVPAGDFATFHVVCRSFRPGLRLPRQTARWDYAPSLGHFVRHSWNAGGRRHELQLSAALPGRLATPARLNQLLQRLQDQP